MKFLEILNGALNIPLAVVQNVSYTKNGNIVETHKNVFTCRGFGCQSLSLNLSLTPAIMPFFSEGNPAMADWSFPDLCNFFLELEPKLDSEPFSLYLDNVAICPELQFSITSITHTMQSDLNGRLQQMDISITLSGVACSKASARNKEVSYDDTDRTPEVSIHCKGKVFECTDVCSITRYQMTPTTLLLELKLGNSFLETLADTWMYTPAQSEDAFISVAGYGKFYIKSASFDGDFVAYECSIFSKSDEAIITKTVMDGSLSVIFDALSLPCICTPAIGAVDVSNYTITKNSIDTLREVTNSLGLLVGFNDNKCFISEVPDSIKPDASANLNYFIDTDIGSAPTTAVTYRDSLHEYTYASGEAGNQILVSSPICTSTNRAKQILRVYNLMENAIDVTIPYDARIRHYSQLTLTYQAKTRNVLVSDYSVDFLANAMTLRCSYLDR